MNKTQRRKLGLCIKSTKRESLQICIIIEYYKLRESKRSGGSSTPINLIMLS